MKWQKKMHFLLSCMSVVYVLTIPIPEDGGDNPTLEQVRKKDKWDNDDYVYRGLILNGMFDPLIDIYQNVESSKELWDSLEAKYMAEDASSKKDFKHTLKHKKEELTLVELGSHLRIEESLRVQDIDKPKSNNVAGPSVVNMKCGKIGHIKKDYKGVNIGNKANGSGTKGLVDGSSNSLKGQNIFNKSLKVYYVTYVSEAYFVQDDDVTWWVDSRETVNVCKDRCWFKIFESLNDGSILHMGNESTALVYGRGCVDLKFSSGKIVSLYNVLHVPNIRKNLVSSSILNNCGYKQVTESNKFVLSKHGAFIGFGYLSNQMFRLNIVNDNIDSAFMSNSELNDSILWHARLGHVYFKRIQDMFKDGLIPAFDMDTKKYEALDKFKVFKIEVELQQGFLIKRFMTDRGDEYMDTLYFQSVGIIHETTAPYTPQQNGIYERKNRVLKEMVNSILSYSGSSQRFRGEAMLTTCYLLNKVSNKRNKITPYEIWTKRKLNINYLRVWGCRAVVRLPDPKLKTLGERGIECIFVEYVDNSKAFRFYVIEPNDVVLINSIIESRDAIFDGNRFSSVSRLNLRIPNETEYIGGLMVPEEVVQQPEPELRISKRNRTPKNFGPGF
ncbi:zinc finger, CCHC-type containing protein [Tanacetum coccineum]